MTKHTYRLITANPRKIINLSGANFSKQDSAYLTSVLLNEFETIPGQLTMQQGRYEGEEWITDAVLDRYQLTWRGYSMDRQEARRLAKWCLRTIPEYDWGFFEKIFCS